MWKAKLSTVTLEGRIEQEMKKESPVQLENRERNWKKWAASLPTAAGRGQRMESTDWVHASRSWQRMRLLFQGGKDREEDSHFGPRGSPSLPWETTGRIQFSKASLLPCTVGPATSSSQHWPQQTGLIHELSAWPINPTPWTAQREPTGKKSQIP